VWLIYLSICRTFTIPTVIKLFSINASFSQNQLACNSKGCRNLFDITIDWACSEAWGGAVCLSNAKLLGIFFSPLQL